MKKILQWLFGKEKQAELQPITIMYCTGWDDDYTTFTETFKQINKLCHPLGYTVDKKNFFVTHYSDLQDKFIFKQDLSYLDKTIQDFGNSTTSHFIIIHSGTCSNMWDYSMKMGKLLLKQKGKISFCNIGYNNFHQSGCSYIVGKDDTKILIESKLFHDNKRKMFEGLDND